jgi:membrane protein YqaA with SNARE-associated domain
MGMGAAITQKAMKFARNPRFPWLVAACGFADMFLFIVPNDLLMMAEAAISPRRRFSSVILVATGSAFGAASFAYALRGGVRLVSATPPSGAWWSNVEIFLKSSGGWALFLGAAAPIPVQPFIGAALISEISLFHIFLFVLGGRILKYSVLALIPTLLPNRFQYRDFP